MTALALPSSTPSPLPGHIWAALPDACVKKAELLRRLIRQCQALKHGDRRDAFAQIAATAGTDGQGEPLLSGETLRKKVYEFRDQGERALLDHKLCKGRCGEPQCAKKQVRRLPQGLIDYWSSEALKNRSTPKPVAQTQTFKWAWKTMLNDFFAGKSLPVVGTWRETWQRENAGSVPPMKCPYTLKHPPIGWSYQNFSLYKPSPDVIAAAQRGMMALTMQLAPVRLDWASLRPQELIFIDDVDLDMKVWGEFEGVLQFVELWALCVMDASTRRIVWMQLHPRWKRKDGTQVGIDRRSVQHCLAQYLMAFGVPKGYGTKIKMENASATITQAVQDVIERVTMGRVTFDRTGLFDASVLLSGFKESGGNPHAKAPLESYFKRMHIELGSIVGQTGANYIVKPGDAPRREAFVMQVLNRVGNAATDSELAAILDVESIRSIRAKLIEGMSRIENNPDHELLGFQEIVNWRWSPHSEHWMSLNGPEMADFLAKGADVVNAFFASDERLRERRMETPVEKWQRTRKDEDFEVLPFEALCDLLMDAVKVKYTGNGFIRAELGKTVIDFQGIRHSALAGQKIVVRFDAEAPEAGCWLQAEDGQGLGRMEWTGRFKYGDREGLEEHLAIRNGSRLRALEETRQIMQPRDELLRKIAKLTEGEQAITTIEQRKQALMPATKASKALAQAVQGKHAEAVKTSAKSTKAAKEAKAKATDLLIAQAKARAGKQ